MNFLVKLYRRTTWHPVYNLLTTGGKARSSLLASTVVQAVINGFTGGIFYTGLLVGYGFDIVNISVLSLISSICSFFTLFSPMVLSRFRRRRMILSATRILYYVVNILGITLLPQFVHSQSGRMAGLIAIIFITGSINAIFSPGYSPWHMSHITEDVRVTYFSSTTLISFVSSSLVMTLASVITDNLPHDAQLSVIVILRYIAFAAALLSVYFLQKPKEPEYKFSTQSISPLKTFRVPLTNRRFMLTILVYAMYGFGCTLSGSTLNTWLLNDVRVSYLYITIIDAAYCLFIPLTTPFWSKMMRKRGTFFTLAISMLLYAPTFLCYACVNAGNYLWLMTVLRLVQHAGGMGLSLSANNMIYINLPEEDQDSYISCYTIIMNVVALLTTSVSTSIVVAIGSAELTLFGLTFSSVPILLLIQAVLYVFTPVCLFLLRHRVDPTAQDPRPVKRK